MHSRLAVLIGAYATLATAIVSVFNNCDDDIYAAFYPPASDYWTHEPLGGFLVPRGEQVKVYLEDGVHIAWGRTGCDAEGNCVTGGGCPGGVNCTGPAPAGPTLAEFHIDLDGEDYYTVSTATGFNIPVSIAPQYPPGNCTVGRVSCTGSDEGVGCGDVAACTTLVNYGIAFCYGEATSETS